MVTMQVASQNTRTDEHTGGYKWPGSTWEESFGIRSGEARLPLLAPLFLANPPLICFIVSPWAEEISAVQYK